LLKGGTTVSAIAEELVEILLRICGRISKRGTVSSIIVSSKHPHSIPVEKGKIKNIDDSIVEVVKNLGRGDIIIISGNALDSQKNVGMMAGWSEPLRLDTLSLNTPGIPESYSLPVISHILLEADSPKMNATSSYYTHLQ